LGTFLNKYTYICLNGQKARDCNKAFSTSLLLKDINVLKCFFINFKYKKMEYKSVFPAKNASGHTKELSSTGIFFIVILFLLFIFQEGKCVENFTAFPLIIINPSIDSVAPKQNSSNISPATDINVYFSQSILPSSLVYGSNICVFGSFTGLKPANIIYNNFLKKLTINFLSNFKSGETVYVCLDTGVHTAGGNPIAPLTFYFMIATSNGSSIFSPASTPSSGSSPVSIITGDFNKDGLIDFAVSNTTGSSTATVFVYLNQGNGIFSNTQTLTTDAWPWSMAAFDFDNDGNIDLAVSEAKFNELSLWKNNGSGYFTLKSRVTLPSGANHIEAVDFNNDGHIDLIASYYTINSVGLLKNDGLGNFTPVSTYSAGNHPSGSICADFDNDGNMDFAVCNTYSNTVSIFRNFGYGAFALAYTANVGISPSGITTLDVNSDGYPDLAVTNMDSHTVTILKNNGNWTFTAMQTIAVGQQPQYLNKGDFNSDGKTDLNVSNNISNSLTVLINNGDWTFTQQATIPTGSGPEEIAVFDMDNDGDLDLAVPCLGTNSINVFRCGIPNPVLISPPNNSYDVTLTPTLTWGQVTGAISYKVQVSTISNFNVITDSATVTSTNYTIPSGKLQPAITYFWRVKANSAVGSSGWSDVWYFSTLITGIKNIGGEIPKEYKLHQNYPNPFNPVTKIRFEIPSVSSLRGAPLSSLRILGRDPVSIKVYDILGRVVSVLINATLQPGVYETIFDAGGLPSGVYFYRIETGRFIETKKLLLLK